MHEKLVLMCMNNKGADQPVHPASLISNFVIQFLESRSLATCKNSIFLLVSVAMQTGLRLTLSQTQKSQMGLDMRKPVLSGHSK